MGRRIFSLALLIFFSLSAANAAWAVPLHIDYYGVVSTSADENMLKMAQDIFFTQLKSIEGISVDDKRQNAATALKSPPDTSKTQGDHIAFFAEIMESASSAAGLWECTFHADQNSLGKNFVSAASYESYYKILVGAKSAIEEVLENYRGNSMFVQEAATEGASHSNVKIDSDTLVGTWEGEPDTDKIIIMRSGKGFIVFKNGATMVVSVSVKEQKGKAYIEILQQGKANASFYPALDRQAALANAPTAKPITWKMNESADGVLTGTKETLVPSLDSATGAEEGTVKVTWTRK